jgi:hypothetical protein
MRRTLLALAIIAPLFSPGLLDPIGNLLVSIWDASENSDAGCIGDPYGSCRPASEPKPNAGCEADPYGTPCPQGS